MAVSKHSYVLEHLSPKAKGGVGLCFRKGPLNPIVHLHFFYTISPSEYGSQLMTMYDPGIEMSKRQTECGNVQGGRINNNTPILNAGPENRFPARRHGDKIIPYPRNPEQIYYYRISHWNFVLKNLLNKSPCPGAQTYRTVWDLKVPEL